MQSQNDLYLTSYSRQHLSTVTHASAMHETTSIMFLESPSLVTKQKRTMLSLVEQMKTDPTVPLLQSSTCSATIPLYGLTDTRII
jgi:hypothetical protein